MVVSSNYNLIPYPGHDYQVQPYHPDNPVIHHEPEQDSIGQHHLFRQQHSDTATRAGHSGFFGNRYDATLCLSYCEADHVGLVVNVFA